MSRAIRKIEVEAVDLLLTEPFSIAGGGAQEARIAVVRVELEDGTTGLGEAAPFPAYDGQTREGTMEAMASAAPALLGIDPLQAAMVRRRIVESAPGSGAATCALEMACCDALARHEKYPLWSLVGAADQQLVTDVTVVAGDLDHAARMARNAFENRFTTVKIKVGRGDLDADCKRLEAIAEAAPGCRMVLDANGGYKIDEALELLDWITREKVPVDLLEQPVQPEDEESMARLTACNQVPICADESCRSVADVHRIAQHRLAHAINIKSQKSGYVESLRIHQVASACQFSLMIGGMVESVLSMSFSAHLARGLGGFRWIDLDTPLFIAEHPFRGGIEFDGGSVTMDDSRWGHGVEYDDSADRWTTLAEE